MARALETRQADALQAEEALRESETRHRSMFANNPLPIWVYDCETLAILDVNGAAVAHYGYTRDEFLAITLANLRPPEDRPTLLEHVARMRSIGLNRPHLRRHRRKDGAIIDVEITSHILQFAGRPARLVLAHDVTERRRAEDDIVRLNTELEQRVVERTAQLQAVNHELETFSDERLLAERTGQPHTKALFSAARSAPPDGLRAAEPLADP
jgi:PAS domain S-box-containing protein